MPFPSLMRPPFLKAAREERVEGHRHHGRDVTRLRASAALDFDALVAGEQAALLRLARRLVWDAEEARDFVQATLADAYEKRRALRDPQAGPAWLRRILVSRAMGLLRRKRMWNVLREVLDLGPAPQPSPEESFEGVERWQAFGRALRSLPTQQATAFTLRYLEGLDLDASPRPWASSEELSASISTGPCRSSRRRMR